MVSIHASTAQSLYCLAKLNTNCKLAIPAHPAIPSSGFPASSTTIVASASVSCSEPLGVAPFDTAAQVPDFLNFRNKLLDAVVKRFVDSIVDMADRDIHLSFGGRQGCDTQRLLLTTGTLYPLEDGNQPLPERLKYIWGEFETVLRLEGRFDHGGEVFSAPYTWMVGLPDDRDAFETYFVISTQVALREQPVDF